MTDPDTDKAVEAIVAEMKALAAARDEVEPDDCQGVHSMVSDDGKHWRCAFCDYKDET